MCEAGGFPAGETVVLQLRFGQEAVHRERQDTLYECTNKIRIMTPH